MTDDDRETFLDITEHLKWDAVWWTTMLLITKLSVRGCWYDSAWDESLARDEMHDLGIDDV